MKGQDRLDVQQFGDQSGMPPAKIGQRDLWVRPGHTASVGAALFVAYEVVTGCALAAVLATPGRAP